MKTDDNSTAVSLFLGILLACILYALVLVTGYALVREYPLSFSETLQGLTFIAVSSAVLIALYVQRKKEQFERSMVYLENGTELIRKAEAVLKRPDGSVSSSRIDWVTAARLISRCEFIASKIEIDAHRLIFESTHDYYRHTLGELFRNDEDFQRAAFFLGTGDSHRSLGQAACDPEQPKDTRNWLPTRVLATVIRFIQYPDGYEDPLDESKDFNEREIEKLNLFGYRGLTLYLRFRKRIIRIGGKAIDLQERDKRRRYLNWRAVDERVR